LLREMRRDEEALDAAEQALALDRKNPYAWEAKSRVLIQLHRCDEFARWLRVGLRLWPIWQWQRLRAFLLHRR
jgi:hypothetical protein